MKLPLAPKKQGVVTSFRSIKKKRKAADNSIGFALFSGGGDDDEYETIKVPERKTVTFGVDLTKLEEWLSGQEKVIDYPVYHAYDYAYINTQ